MATKAVKPTERDDAFVIIEAMQDALKIRNARILFLYDVIWANASALIVAGRAATRRALRGEETKMKPSTCAVIAESTTKPSC